MTAHTHAGQETIAQATRDIHERCKVEIDLLWNDGKSSCRGDTHKIKVWNGLGAVHSFILDRDLVERGAAYRQFLDRLAESINLRLTVQP